MTGSRTILGGILTICLVAGLIGASYTGAFFADVETSEDNTFSAGTLDLQVGDTDPVTWHLDENILPGDSGGNNTSIKNTGSIDGFLRINFTNLLNEENGLTEPEESMGDDADTGELAENLFITVYFDNDNSTTFTDGDTLIYQGMANNTTSSLLNAKLVDSELLAGGTENFRIDWELNGETGNEVQSDKMQFDLPFELTQNSKTVLEGLVGYWTLNEKGNIAHDYSGNGNDGTIYGATLTNGKSGGALSFDGNDDYVDVSGVGSYTTGSTWFAWFNTAAIITSGYTTIIGFRECLNQYAMDNKVHIYANDGNWTELISNTIISADTWYLYTAVHNGSTLKLYINGVYDTEIPCSTLIPDPAFPKTRIGIRANDQAPFDGTIDEVRIYNRALTPAEILQNFNAGN